MTRFARAKGSKSSNEKVPEEATPWSELKKDLTQQEGIKEEARTRLTALKNMEEKEPPTEWANLDNANYDSFNMFKRQLQNSNVNSEIPCESTKIAKVGTKRKHTGEEVIETKMKRNNDQSEKNTKRGSENLVVGQNKKKKKKATSTEGKIKKIKKSSDSSSKKLSIEKNLDNNIDDKNSRKTKSKKLKSETPDENSPKKLEKKMKNFASGKSLKLNKKLVGVNKSEQKGVSDNGKKNKITKNRKKLSDSNITNINIGGEIVSLTKYQGFFVTLEDGKRLAELKRKMVEEGIPKNQIESAIKLERRRCEKKLARMRKNVCFNCRKPGHILSQCTELHNNLDTATDVCYKCGSTEHKAFVCKVAQGKNFPFAECFICKEKGHIARECPDNPRGLYPNGGCCKLCGAVTHLKKDCPTRISENEEKTIKVGVRNDKNLEGLEDDMKTVVNKDKKIKKPIKF